MLCMCVCVNLVLVLKIASSYMALNQVHMKIIQSLHHREEIYIILSLDLNRIDVLIGQKSNLSAHSWCILGI